MSGFTIGEMSLNDEGIYYDKFNYKVIRADLKEHGIELFVANGTSMTSIPLTPAQAKEFGTLMLKAATAHGDMVLLMSDLEKRTAAMTQETLDKMARLTS